MKTVESKIWGTALKIHDNGLSKTTVLEIKKGGTCSWHYHEHRYNAFYVVSGEIVVRWCPGIRGDKNEIYLKAGNDLVIAPGESHEFMAMVDSVVVEVDYAHDRIGDIVRLRPGFVQKRVRDKRVKNVRLGRKP